jgi:flagellar protein FliO/FliZ
MMGGYVWYFSALLLVVGLILALAWVARRLGLMGRLGAVGGKRRLSLIEVLPLDAKRRLVLIRRDGTEHLVLLGHVSDLVIERGIGETRRQSDFAATLEATRP